MSKPEVYDDAFVAGDTYNLSLYYKDSDGVPIDLTGYTIDMHLRKSLKDDEYMLAKDWLIDAVSGEAGLIQILLSTDETELLVIDCGYKASYVYDIQLTNVAGDEVQTIIGGVMEVTKGVTR